MEIEKEFCPYHICDDLIQLGLKANSPKLGAYSKDKELFIRNISINDSDAFLWQQAIDFIREKYNIIIDLSKVGDDTDDWHFALNLRWEYFRGTYYEARQQAVEKAIQIIKEKHFFIK